jgi:hypothetical protein
MSFLSRSMSTVLLVMAGFPGILQGQNAHRHTPAVIPMSSPFTLVDAVNLPEWTQIRRLTEQIQTDAGSLELLREMPLVAAKYADESFFLDLVKKWRARVPALPKKPSVGDAADSSWVVLQNGQSRTISITFYDDAPENSITILAITWTDQQITNLSFTGGFDNVLGKHRRHHHDSGRPEDFRRNPN